nr:ABC transporter permease [uncultured Caproiciproducens sp.]
MKTFFNVLKNNYLRTIPRLAPTILMTVITLLTIILAVYVTGLQQVKGHVAMITQSSTMTLPKSSKQLNITVMSQKPPHSDLVKQKYDAFVSINANGGYDIETLHNSDFKNTIALLLKYPNAHFADSKTERGTGVNIIGFMMMFLLMIAFSNLFAFADDKEQGQLHRIAASPASFGWYLAAHCAYCLSFLMPAFIMLAVLKWCGWNIGFSLLQYAGLMAVLGILGISFALLLHTFIKKPDNANMLGNSVTVLTSILAGGFYSFSKNNSVLDNIIKLLPQKELMDFAQHLQNGNGGQHVWSIIYVVGFSLVLFLFSCTVLRRMYVKKV